MDKFSWYQIEYIYINLFVAGAEVVGAAAVADVVG